MKKSVIILTATALALAIPTSGFAQSKPASKVITQAEFNGVKYIPGFGDVTIQEVIHTKNGLIEKDGENDYYAGYSTSMGDTIRFYLKDTNQKGMTIKIYYVDADDNITSLFASGTTSSSNNWMVLQETPAPKNDANFLVRIISNDGDGGYEYPFESAIRAF